VGVNLDELLRGASVFVIGSDKARSKALPSQHGAARVATDASAERGPFDVVLVAEWRDKDELGLLAERAGSLLKPGGCVAFYGPMRDEARRSLRGMLRRRPRARLEEVCEALLLADFVDVRASDSLDGEHRLVIASRAGGILP
jgi:hypothetical protein